MTIIMKRKKNPIQHTIETFNSRAYLRGGVQGGGGGWGFKPPLKFSDLFLKSEGKEIERKRRDVGGGGGVTT